MSNFLDVESKKQIPLNKVLNSIIEGDNLQVMKELITFYENKIKLIYIDPPYNTKRKFIYNDNFGSHQNWVEMMRPRLEIAHKILKDDGFIFVSIDDNEVHYLRILMDKIFGEENFRNCIIVPRGTKNVQAQFLYSNSIAIGHEYVLFYSKKKDSKIKKFEINRSYKKAGTWNNHWRGTDRPNLRYELFGISPKKGQWRWSKERSLIAIQNYISLLVNLNKTNNESNIKNHEIDNWFSNQVTSGKKIDLLRLGKTGKPEHYVPSSETKLGNDVWMDINVSGNKDLKKILKNTHFDMPKSVELIKRIIKIVTVNNRNDIILDFFAGSGTTAQAILELNKEDNGNRSFILIQTPEKISDSTIISSEKENTISNLTYQRIQTFSEINNLDINIKFLYQSIPNVINSSSAGGGGGALTSSSNPPIIKVI
ncbi:site-specific DNA-methyltransferase [Silvanigrella sp.]|jgi:adenine-specific DNA-methyltransferase|uniref:site-specific DNA-methyltransferase n=1 Tax=Silvanigrella sp. TaxID=2024976 RepID=UPI0037CBC318